MTTPQALAGIRVLDFTRVLAGPLCTMMLGDLGADVVKIEQPPRGDDTRQWGPPWFGPAEDGISAYFASVNRNKRSITLNLRHPAGRDIARRLAQKAHILVENFKVGDMERFGLAYEELRTQNPGLVYCRITGYGQTGPHRERPGYDYVVQAMSGLMAITGEANGAPQKVGVAISDVITGLTAANAIQAALRHAEQTDQGQIIDIALLDSQIAALVNIASNFLANGQEPTRMGNAHPNIVPYQTFHASDGDFVVGVGNDRQFTALCHLIAQPELATDPRFSTNPARVQHRQELITILDKVFQRRTCNEWVSAILQAGIPAGPIRPVSAALTDEHARMRGLVHRFDAMHPIDVVASPLGLIATPPQYRIAPPAVGTHTSDILRDWLSLDKSAQAELISAGAFRE